MRHLVCVRLHEGWARRGPRYVVTTGWMLRQSVEPIDEAQHVRHEYVGNRERSSQPFAARQHPLHVTESVLEEVVQLLPSRRSSGVAGELQYGPGQACRLDRIEAREQPFDDFAATMSLGGHQRVTALSEMKQDRAALEDREVSIDQPGHLAERLVREMPGTAIAKWCAPDAIGQPGLFQR